LKFYVNEFFSLSTNNNNNNNNNNDNNNNNNIKMKINNKELDGENKILKENNYSKFHGDVKIKKYNTINNTEDNIMKSEADNVKSLDKKFDEDYLGTGSDSDSSSDVVMLDSPPPSFSEKLKRKSSLVNYEKLRIEGQRREKEIELAVLLNKNPGRLVFFFILFLQIIYF
jgi:hypothetical protein